MYASDGAYVCTGVHYKLVTFESSEYIALSERRRPEWHGQFSEHISAAEHESILNYNFGSESSNDYP